MKLLIIAQHFWPEEVSGAVLATQLAEDLVDLGHEVTFLTSAPSYPKGVVFENYKNKLFSSQNYGKVRVIRTWSYISKSKSLLSRTLNFLSFSFSSLFGGLFAGPFDVIFSYSPPLTLGISAWLINLLKNIPWILRVEDLYPDAAIATGVIKNKFLIKLLNALEKFLYTKASHISLISEEFRRIIISKGGINPDKLSVTPVWADPEEMDRARAVSEIPEMNHLTEKFLILYSGNLGTTSNLTDLVNAADKLKTNENIKFLIVGEGVQKQNLERLVIQKGLSNVDFVTYQDRPTYWVLMNMADFGVVTINPDSASYSLPSKVFNIMAAQCPVLSVSPEGSEIAKLVKKHNCGVNVEPGKISELSKQITYFYENEGELKPLGVNGFRALNEFYSREVCIQQIYQQIQSAYFGR